MKKKGQLANNDSALKNSEVCDFSEKSGKPRVLCDFATLREKEITTENTKKAQRKATSYELRATSREKKAASGQENFFEPLCETSVSSVVKENLNTGGKAASRKLQAMSRGPFATLRLSRLNIGTSCEKKILCAFAPWREKFFTTKQPKLETCNLKPATYAFGGL